MPRNIHRSTRTKSIRYEKSQKADALVLSYRKKYPTPESQLKNLDDIMGKGIGAKRQRTRLSKLLENKHESSKK